MEEPLETVYVDTIPVLSDDEMARSSDVTPWVNDLGRPCEDYRFASHLDVVEDRQIEFPTGYEEYQNGLGWHDWKSEDWPPCPLP